jgi:predicted esterase
MKLSEMLALAGLLWISTAAHAQKNETVPRLSDLSQAKPSEAALFVSSDEMEYFLRLPKNYDAEKGARLIVFMHGSNMCGLTYLRSFEGAKWCGDDILVCPNGEASGDDPYGANNFGFASANPVATVTREVQEAFNVTRTYIGGHSQGGFVTYSSIMHFPELYQGALPMAGDCWMQNEPNLWEGEPEKLTLQKKIPIAIIHGQKDPIVAFAQGEHAHNVFRAACYPKLRFFAPEKLGHQFMLSPVDEALEWLDAMNAADPATAIERAQGWADPGEWGWACQAALAVNESMSADEESKKIALEILQRAEAPAAKAASEISQTIKGDATGNWVTSWFDFHAQFGSTDAAKKMVENYFKRRADQREPAEKLFWEARQLLRDDKKPDAYAMLEKLLADYPCTYHAFYAKDWLDHRTDKPAPEKFR